MELVEQPAEKLSLAQQLEAIRNTYYIATEGEEYVPWFAENDEAIGIQFCTGKYNGVFVYVLKDNLRLNGSSVSFSYTVNKNPNFLSQQALSNADFKLMLGNALNDLLAKVWAFEQEKAAK